MRPAIIPLIGTILLGPVFVEASVPDRNIAANVNAIVKAIGDYAAALPQLPLIVEKYASRAVPAMPDNEDIGTPTDVAIEVVCRTLAQAAESNGLPVGFFARLIWTESRFRQRAVSHAGAQGVAQFMPATAAEYGLADPFNPVAALPASARFLRKLHEQFGNLGLAAAAYNAGGGRVQDWLARKKTLPAETQNYVRAVTGQAAENWTRDSKDIDLEHKLPRAAPCEGEAGLSPQSKPIAMKVALSATAGEIVRKAEIAEEEARQAKIETERRALAALRSNKGKPTQLAKAKTGKGHIKIAAKAATKATTKVAAKAARKGRLKVASAGSSTR